MACRETDLEGAGWQNIVRIYLRQNSDCLLLTGGVGGKEGMNEPELFVIKSRLS
jgi:hypothetical protein